MIAGWVDAISAEVRASMAARPRFTPAQLAEALGVSQACAVQYITLLADAGRLDIEVVVLPAAPSVRRVAA